MRVNYELWGGGRVRVRGLERVSVRMRERQRETERGRGRGGGREGKRGECVCQSWDIWR